MYISLNNCPIFIDREAGEIMHLVASVCLSVCLCVCVHLREHSKWLGVQKMVVVSTGCAVVVDHAFTQLKNC